MPKPCTCSDYQMIQCRGTKDLGEGWYCVLEPLTPEDAQAAYDAAEPVPVSKERIKEIVRYATEKGGD